MPLFARFLLLPCLFVLFTGALPPAFGQDGMRCSPDVNADEMVDANDALVLYYAYSLTSVLGSGRGAGGGGGGGSGSFTAGDTFRDCPGFPEMVVVPSGTFTMGSPASEGGPDEERPQHEVTIARFAVGTHEVTFAEYDACHAAGGCSREPRDRHNSGRGNYPVIDINWNEAKEYVAWLSQGTGATYRLLTESEWEYAARAGSTMKYPWGNDIGSGNANCFDCGGTSGGTQKPTPAGTFEANAFGLYDTVGNVQEWVEDCWHADYGEGDDAAPTDGSAWEMENDGNCNQRVLRGGSTISSSGSVRSAKRASAGGRDNHRGFRVARTLD